MTTKVKNKNDYEELMQEHRKENDETRERLKKKDYVLTVYQKGDSVMSCGDPNNMVDVRRFYAVCSLEEIPEYIQYMKQSFWTHEEGLTKKEIKNYPFEKKRWGRYSNVVIEPLSEEMEKSYLDASKKGFFESWRMIQEEDEKEQTLS
ncbi:MAG: hypothetical protein H8D80_00410 [Proteobacteria bacterium]|nr:hypothetical protein [Pseudomonadota bacterium]